MPFSDMEYPSGLRLVENPREHAAFLDRLELKTWVTLSAKK
jgi:hypothetical protein